jgi:Flp pilus assembly protein TadD
VLVHEPKNVEAMVRLGASLFETNRLHEALFHFWRARKIDRRNPQAVMNYGLTLSQLGYPEEGIEDIERAVRLGDKFEKSPYVRAMQYNNLGNCLERLGRHAQALEAIDRGLYFDGNEGFAHYNRGVVLSRLGRHEEAKVALKQSLRLANVAHEGLSGRLNEADARYNLGIAQLLTGELGEGFKNYEYRLMTSTENPQQQPNFGLDPDRKWLGDSLYGKRLLVHGEQGLGDAIQMLRFLPWLSTLGPSEILFVEHAGIRTILRDEPGVTVLEPGESLLDQDGKPRYDLWVAVMSLPYCFGITEEEHIPEPYSIRVEDERIQHWKSRLNAAPNVAVCWAGNFRHKNDAHRSIPLELFSRIFEAPGINFVSVQQVREEEKPQLAGLQECRNLQVLTLDDLRDTAAVIMNCDLVITVDTAIAHLAGSLGVKTWTLIYKFGTDWRWQLGRIDSPWYPSMTLYRQHKIGDWKTVLDRVKSDLQMFEAGLLAA